MQSGKDRTKAWNEATLVGFALLILVALLQGGYLLGQGIVSAFAASPAGAPEWLLGLYNLIMSVVAFVVPYLFLQRTGRPLGLRISIRKSPIPLWIILPLFIGIMVGINSLSNLLQSLLSALMQLPQAEATALPASVLGRVFYFVSICVVAPVFEELLFRGAVQGMLRGWGAKFSIWMTAVLFTLMHANVWELPTVFVLSLLLCYVAEVSHSVRPCIVLHFANNFFSFLMMLARENMETIAAMALIFWLMLAFVALFVGAVWALRYFRLGPRLRLPKEQPNDSVAKRLAALAKTPAFIMGFCVCVAHFVLSALGL